MKKTILIKYLFYSLLVICVFIGCKNPPNDDDIYISGQFYIYDNDTLVPLREKVKSFITVTYYCQSCIGAASYEGYFVRYSEDDGSFIYEVQDVGSYVVELSSSFFEGDTVQYHKDTFIHCTNGRPQTNVKIPLVKHHLFNTKIEPKRIMRNDSITISINHDGIVLIEACDLIVIPGGTKRFETFQQFEVDNKRSYTFKLDYDLIKEKDDFYLFFTTAHYGKFPAKYILFYDEQYEN